MSQSTSLKRISGLADSPDVRRLRSHHVPGRPFNVPVAVDGAVPFPIKEQQLSLVANQLGTRVTENHARISLERIQAPLQEGGLVKIIVGAAMEESAPGTARPYG
jgi:hypothetical protein